MIVQGAQSVVESFLRTWQNSLCTQWASLDEAIDFHADIWHSALGQGETRTVAQNPVFAAASVNFSRIAAPSLPVSALPNRTQYAGKPYIAMGVSTVIHPVNPYVPTSHANLRFFIVDPEGDQPYWWFGGGFDLTPYYGFDADCILWHQYAKRACDQYGDDAYPLFKAECDRYFFLPHRNEARGIGGIFFDNIMQGGFTHCFDFIQAVGQAYTDAYDAIVQRRMHTPFSDMESDFQAYRRGRYVEFNLLHDRGTRFGIDSGGRTESILVSMPPQATWRYNWQPQPHSPEAQLTEHFLKPRAWLDDGVQS